MIDTDYEMIVELVAIAKERGYQFPFTDTALYKDQLLYGNTWVVLVLFSHDFAKAVFGEEKIEVGYDDIDLEINGPQPLLGGTVYYPYGEGAGVDCEWVAWKYHLLNLAICPETDRIKYAYEHRLK